MSTHSICKPRVLTKEKRKARIEEQLKKFLNISCALVDYHRKSTSKRWTIPISPFLYQHMIPTIAGCGFSGFGRHAHCYSCSHVHIQTMHHKVWIQSCETMNKSKIMDFTFFREMLKKDSDGDVNIENMQKIISAPITKREMILNAKYRKNQLGMFPEFINIHSPMLLHRRKHILYEHDSLEINRQLHINREKRAWYGKNQMNEIKKTVKTYHRSMFDQQTDSNNLINDLFSDNELVLSEDYVKSELNLNRHMKSVIETSSDEDDTEKDKPTKKLNLNFGRKMGINGLMEKGKVMFDEDGDVIPAYEFVDDKGNLVKAYNNVDRMGNIISGFHAIDSRGNMIAAPPPKIESVDVAIEEDSSDRYSQMIKSHTYSSDEDEQEPYNTFMMKDSLMKKEILKEDILSFGESELSDKDKRLQKLKMMRDQRKHNRESISKKISDDNDDDEYELATNQRKERIMKGEATKSDYDVIKAKLKERKIKDKTTPSNKELETAIHTGLKKHVSKLRKMVESGVAKDDEIVLYNHLKNELDEQNQERRERIRKRDASSLDMDIENEDYKDLKKRISKMKIKIASGEADEEEIEVYNNLKLDLEELHDQRHERIRKGIATATDFINEKNELKELKKDIHKLKKVIDKGDATIEEQIKYQQLKKEKEKQEDIKKQYLKTIADIKEKITLGVATNSEININELYKLEAKKSLEQLKKDLKQGIPVSSEINLLQKSIKDEKLKSEEIKVRIINGKATESDIDFHDKIINDRNRLKEARLRIKNGNPTLSDLELDKKALLSEFLIYDEAKKRIQNGTGTEADVLIVHEYEKNLENKNQLLQTKESEHRASNKGEVTSEANMKKKEKSSRRKKPKKSGKNESVADASGKDHRKSSSDKTPVSKRRVKQVKEESDVLNLSSMKMDSNLYSNISKEDKSKMKDDFFSGLGVKQKTKYGISKKPTNRIRDGKLISMAQLKEEEIIRDNKVKNTEVLIGTKDRIIKTTLQNYLGDNFELKDGTNYEFNDEIINQNLKENNGRIAIEGYTDMSGMPQNSYAKIETIKDDYNDQLSVGKTHSSDKVSKEVKKTILKAGNQKGRLSKGVTFGDQAGESDDSDENNGKINLKSSKKRKTKDGAKHGKKKILKENESEDDNMINDNKQLITMGETLTDNINNELIISNNIPQVNIIDSEETKDNSPTGILNKNGEALKGKKDSVDYRKLHDNEIDSKNNEIRIESEDKIDQINITSTIKDDAKEVTTKDGKIRKNQGNNKSKIKKQKRSKSKKKQKVAKLPDIKNRDSIGKERYDETNFVIKDQSDKDLTKNAIIPEIKTEEKKPKKVFMIKENNGRTVYKVQDGTVLFYGDEDGTIRRNDADKDVTLKDGSVIKFEINNTQIGNLKSTIISPENLLIKPQARLTPLKELKASRRSRRSSLSSNNSHSSASSNTTKQTHIKPPSTKSGMKKYIKAKKEKMMQIIPKIVHNQDSMEMQRSAENKAKYGNIQGGHGVVNILLPPEKDNLDLLSNDPTINFGPQALRKAANAGKTKGQLLFQAKKDAMAKAEAEKIAAEIAKVESKKSEFLDENLETVAGSESTSCDGTEWDSRHECGSGSLQALNDECGIQWFQTKLDINLTSTRFEIPVNLKKLKTLKPLEYLKKYSRVSSHRSQLALQFFNRHHKRARLLSMDIIGLKRALLDLFVEHIDDDKIEEIIGMLGLRYNDKCDLVKDNLVDLNLEDFNAIVAFTERYICPRVDEETGRKLDRDKLESLDFMRAVRQLKTNNVCEPMVDILHAIF